MLFSLSRVHLFDNSMVSKYPGVERCCCSKVLIQSKSISRVCEVLPIVSGDTPSPLIDSAFIRFGSQTPSSRSLMVVVPSVFFLLPLPVRSLSLFQQVCVMEYKKHNYIFAHYIKFFKILLLPSIIMILLY